MAFRLLAALLCLNPASIPSGLNAQTVEARASAEPPCLYFSAVQELVTLLGPRSRPAPVYADVQSFVEAGDLFCGFQVTRSQVLAVLPNPVVDIAGGETRHPQGTIDHGLRIRAAYQLMSNLVAVVQQISRDADGRVDVNIWQVRFFITHRGLELRDKTLLAGS